MIILFSLRLIDRLIGIRRIPLISRVTCKALMYLIMRRNVIMIKLFLILVVFGCILLIIIIVIIRARTLVLLRVRIIRLRVIRLALIYILILISPLFVIMALLILLLRMIRVILIVRPLRVMRPVIITTHTQIRYAFGDSILIFMDSRAWQHWDRLMALLLSARARRRMVA